MNRLTEKVKNIDDYIKLPTKDKQAFINKLGKLEDLEEQLGCPLEVRCNVFYNSTIYNCLRYKMTVKETYDDHFIAVIENDIFSFDYKDYKKHFWLRKDKSE